MDKQKPERRIIEEIKDWGDHQYIPGYFTGGRIPHWMRDSIGGRPVGIAVSLTGVIFGIVALHRGMRLATLPAAAFSLALLLAGIWLMRKKRN